jgi:hypothetical protein
MRCKPKLKTEMKTIRKLSREAWLTKTCLHNNEFNCNRI